MKAPVVTITYGRTRVAAWCTVCGWAWARRRTPAGPGEDLPDRPPSDLQIAAEGVADKHLRSHLVRR